ncbi:MAG: UbiA family prenyltransferase [Syntrophomonadaceae bacterium]|jgi:4-hydroxybenzoate polyprenyltransferase|nr:UbiA family prenyltransferase [Syntrophomonadaceae bacterium]
MVWNKIYQFLRMIDFGYTVFGLPFAYLGAFLAIKGIPTLSQLLWITVAMIGARTAALCLNRLIDREIDRRNPRTSHWVMARGGLPAGAVWAAVFFNLALLFLAASQLNMLCVKLAPLAVLVLWGYSYTKRFTWWCHLILGLAIGMGPIGAWIAVTGTLDWQPFVLGLAVACWIAGFDTMYACQDVEFDRREGLYSIPARFGVAGALRFARGFHVMTVTFFLLAGLVLGLGWWYYAGIAFAAAILVYEHSLVHPQDLSLVNVASFKVNRYVSLVMFIATLADLL